ncbi:MAG: T9SS type A sorting domain-containing protein [Saprospiraceae bacterium]|nr:T9SS type A sorting domain-containing protein [Saprospiraceae bacterium]MBK7812454.1 T9SS type A sorting domain-containing protein [Saprospiraceae bacterium]
MTRDHSSKPWIVKVDQYGCLVPGCESSVSTENPNSIDLNLSLYPNPAVHTISLLDNINKSKDLQLMLYDVSGRELMCNIFKSQQGKQHIFNLSPDLPNGLYLLQIV